MSRPCFPALRVSYLALGLLLLGGCASKGAPSTGHGAFGARAGSPGPAQLERTIPSLMEQAGIPGLSVAVCRRGLPIWTRAYGVRSVETGKPVTAETVFEAASLSKPVFAWAVMRLVERGELDLDEPLAAILPYERLAHEERYLRITPRMVLTHSTGLPNWGDERLDLAFDPGERFSYSGEGFVYLQKAVEKVTGKPLDEFLRREVFEPLGMSSSSYVWKEAYAATSAAPHDILGRPQPKGQPGEGNAASSLHTTAGDYARFVSALLEEKGLRSETLDAIFSPRIRARNEDGEPAEAIAWGLGWALESGESGTAFWHWGDNGPFKAFVLGYRDRGTALVYFANSSEGLSITGDVLAAAFGGEHASVEWLDYDRHDAPGRVAWMTVARAFIEEGDDAGRAAFEKLLEESPEIADEPFVERLGDFLLDEGRHGPAIDLFRSNVARHPDSSDAHSTLGSAWLRAGRMESSVESCRRALEIDPQNGDAERALQWAGEALRALESPVRIPAELLAAYAGDYGSRHVHLEESVLYYERDERPRYRLYPISLDTFGLEELGVFRLRFERDASGRVSKLIGLYFGGGRDESPRDP